MRTITLMAYISNKKEIEEIEDYCKKNQLNYQFKDKKQGSYYDITDRSEQDRYYFSIFGNTKEYEKLINTFPNQKIVTTEYADLGNEIDCTEDFLQQFIDCIRLFKEETNIRLKANKKFLEFIMPIKDVKVLQQLKKYECYMSEHQKRTIDIRIDIVNNEREKVDEEFTESILCLYNDVKELREQTGMSRKEFSNYFDIPYRTLQDWELKKSTCSSYLFKLMKKDLIQNNMILTEIEYKEKGD